MWLLIHLSIIMIVTNLVVMLIKYQVISRLCQTANFSSELPLIADHSLISGLDLFESIDWISCRRHSFIERPKPLHVSSQVVSDSIEGLTQIGVRLDHAIDNNMVLRNNFVINLQTRSSLKPFAIFTLSYCINNSCRIQINHER